MPTWVQFVIVFTAALVVLAALYGRWLMRRGTSNGYSSSYSSGDSHNDKGSGDATSD